MLVAMRFTEHELTIAVTAAAKTVAGAKGRRRGDADAVWESMSKLDRYHHLEAVGSQVLPVLLALPDVEVPAGTRPTFTDAQVLAAVGHGIDVAHPERREGFYYLVRVANSGEALAGATFVLRVISPLGPDPKIISFPVEIPKRSKVFLLGLTGPEWPNQEVHPVAWKLELRSPTDEILASAQSFLWQKPAK